MRIASLLFISLAACTVGDDVPVASTPHDHAPSVERAKTQKSSNLTDHGGTILTASHAVAIYWGTATDFPSDLRAGMASLLGNLGGSPYLHTIDQYMRGATATTTYGGAVTDPSAPPKSAPNTAALGAEVCKLFANPDPNALYIVFTSNAPKINYCAWHDKTTCNGVTFQVAYVPNQAALPGCSPTTGAAGDLACNSYSAGTVTAADSVAHELIETITDAHIDAWYDANKAEIADKCEYQYDACVTLGADHWQIQKEWSNAVSGCVQTTN